MLQAVCQTSLTIHSSTLAWVEKISFIRVKCLVQEQNTMTRQGWNPDFSTPSPLCQPQGHQISQLHWNTKKFKLPVTQLTWLLEYKKAGSLNLMQVKRFPTQSSNLQRSSFSLPQHTLSHHIEAGNACSYGYRQKVEQRQILNPVISTDNHSINHNK